MEEKLTFTNEEIKQITDHFNALIDDSNNPLNREISVTDDNILVLSFSCEERQFRNNKKDRIGFRGFRIRMWKETPEVYMGSINTFGWIIPYHHKNKKTISYMSLLKGKLSDLNFKLFPKL